LTASCSCDKIPADTIRNFQAKGAEMGSIFKRKGYTNLYARFMVNGRDYCFSTGTRNRKEAEKILRQKQGMIKGTTFVDDHFNEVLNLIEKLPKKIRETKRQEFVAILLRGNTVQLKIEDAWQAWVESPMKRNPSERTIADYKTIWRRFKIWAKDRSFSYLHELTSKDAQDFCAGLWKSGLAPRTYNGYVKFLKAAFNVLKDQAGLVKNIWQDIPSMGNERESRRNLTPEELTKVCQTATGNMRYMFALGIYTGMRLGDICHIKWNEIDFDTGFIEHTPLKTKRTNKKVRLPIHPVLNEMMKELKAVSGKNEYIFPEEYEQYQKDSTAISKKTKKHFQSCGIQTTEKPKNRHRKLVIVRVGFHSLRHSFVSLCAANRVPQVAIQELVGHGSPAMTALYSHAGDEQKIKAIAGLPAIDFDSSTTK
jgi:integrase